MITIKKATREVRRRDRKRKRFLLQVGDNEWHITPEEARCLYRFLDILFGKGER